MEPKSRPSLTSFCDLCALYRIGTIRMTESISFFYVKIEHLARRLLDQHQQKAWNICMRLCMYTCTCISVYNAKTSEVVGQTLQFARQVMVRQGLEKKNLVADQLQPRSKQFYKTKTKGRRASGNDYFKRSNATTCRPTRHKMYFVKSETCTTCKSKINVIPLSRTITCVSAHCS